MASLLPAGALLVLVSLGHPLPAPAAEETLKREIRGIIDLFYDLRFEQALAAADGLIVRFPGHPAGPFYRSIVSYQRYLQQDSGAQAAFAEFERESTRALEAAKAVAGERPATAEYYQGAALGFQARALVAGRHYASAIPKARRAVRHLRRAWKQSRKAVTLGARAPMRSKDLRPYKGYKWIVADPRLLGGGLAVRGTRLSVRLILECLSNGMTLADIDESFDHSFPREALPEVLKVAAELADSVHVAA